MKKTRKMRVGRADDLGEKRSLKFSFRQAGRRQEGFVIRIQGTLKAFVNRCPHAGAPLDFGDNEFFTEDGLFLACKTHGALFEPRDGSCVAGPCPGQALEPLPVALTPQGGIEVTLP
jgi:nitrite reductase/ring-hydroxylating ferredoxin subunit